MKREDIKFPPMMYLAEGDIRRKCEVCGSSLKRKFFVKVLGCYSPECKKYWKTYWKT